MEKKCPQCDEPVLTRSEQAKYCSAQCKQRAKYIRKRDKGRSKTFKGRDYNQQGGREFKDKTEFSGDTGYIERILDHQISTPEELLKACNIDPAEWTVVTMSVAAWSTGMKFKATKSGEVGEAAEIVDEDGHAVDAKIKYAQQYSVRAKLARNHQGRFARAVIDGLLEDCAKKSPKPPRITYAPLHVKSGNMAEVSLYDHHFGLLAWGKETGWQDYDLDKADALWDTATDKLFERIQPHNLQQITMVMGNDLFHVDSRRNMTFAGTPQDVDTRYRKLVQHVNAIVRDQIDRMREIAPVRVITIPGNHDPETVFHLGEVLHAYYHNDPHVEIDIEPAPRKYYRWGRNLVGLQHGTCGKGALQKLPMIMARERQRDWSDTWYRFFNTGHLHHESSMDIQGVIVRRMMNLVPPCAWASENLYVGSARGAQAFIMNDQEGLIAEPRYQVPDDSPPAIIDDAQRARDIVAQGVSAREGLTKGLS